MKIDDSFKKPGAVPFKWEIRPGVPRIHNQQQPSDEHHHHFKVGFQKQQQQVQQNQSPRKSTQNSPNPETSTKLKPPPARVGLYFQPQSEPQIRSFRSSPRTSSLRFRIPVLAQPDIVTSPGCFPSSPLVKPKKGNKRTSKLESRSEPDYISDLDLPSRWSTSSRKSVSPLSSSFASYQSSPRPARDAEWASFGLF